MKFFRRIVSIIFAGVLIVSVPAGASSEAICKALPHHEWGQRSREYMKTHGLILEGEEQSFEDFDIQIAWKLMKAVSAPRGCFLVMSLCSTTGGVDECRSAHEVLGLKLSEDQSTGTIVPFEKLQAVPKSVVAKIGGWGDVDPSYYYVKLSGNSALAAVKSVVTSTPYYGFSGVAVKGNKAAFDPTPNRMWKIENGKFDLRRGSTAEVLDVQAYQLDGLDSAGAEAYWQGCDQPGGIYGKCNLAPWGQAFVLEIL